ncbi:MAG: D-2-hydroxyacid dehydrogenase family protein [Burkholderiaceae bacterium]
MKIGILDDYQHCVQALNCYQILNGHHVKIFTNSARGTGQLAIRLASFEALVLIGDRTHFPKSLLEKLPNLKLISQVGNASDHIDMAAATARGMAIAESVADPVAPAELTWALIMAATRKIPQYASNLKNGTWQTVALSPAHNSLGVALKNRTLGIWGYGKIGRLVAAYGKAFGMQVVVWGREASRAAAVADGFHAAASRESFFADCDVVSLHLRLNDATREIVTNADFARMKTNALFVNTSSAELVERDALIPALQQGRPGYAALDVFDTEPLPPDSPLLKMPNVLATPHIGFVEKDSYEMLFHVAFQNIIDFANKNPRNILNPEALQ